MATVAIVANQFGTTSSFSEITTSLSTQESKNLNKEPVKNVPQTPKSNPEPRIAIVRSEEPSSISKEKITAFGNDLIAKIKELVKTTSGNKATLQIKNLSDLDHEELGKLKNSLERQKSLFQESNLGDTNVNNKKTILFEKDGNDWKHSKTEIKKWEESNKLEIKIKKDGEDATTIDSTDEGKLEGLFNYLKENQQKLLKYKNPTTGNKLDLTLEKNGNWDVVHSEETINNWVSNTSNKKAKLKLYDGNSEKQSSKITVELNQLFAALREDLFKKDLVIEEDPKIVVFEKYGRDENNKSWMHVKDAIKDFIGDENDLNWIKIENGNSRQEEYDKAKDSELIGLLANIQNNKNTYKDETTLILKKDTTCGWQKI